MAYGQGRRTLAEKEYSAVSVFGFGLMSALGIGAAVIVDLVQQQQASALYVINRWILEVTSLLGVQTIPLYGVMLILMLIGGLSVLFFQPMTLRGAFTQGFGVLAALVTIAPSDIGEPLMGPASNAGSPTRDLSSEFEPVGLVGQPVHRGVQRVPASLQGDEYQLRIQVNFRDGLRQDMQTMIRRNTLVGKLWNPETGRRYNIFRGSGAEIEFNDEEGVLRIVTRIEAADADAQLWILIEAAGYEITEESFDARSGPNPIWTIDMQPSNVPLLVQRLRHSYRF